VFTVSPSKTTLWRVLLSVPVRRNGSVSAMRRDRNLSPYLASISELVRLVVTEIRHFSSTRSCAAEARMMNRISGDVQTPNWLRSASAPRSSMMMCFSWRTSSRSSSQPSSTGSKAETNMVALR